VSVFDQRRQTVILMESSRDHVVLTHTIQVQNESTGAWYLAYVDAESGEVVNLVDFVSDASVCRTYFNVSALYSPR
jgi:extracellular elastinolytic metalloproteinase